MNKSEVLSIFHWSQWCNICSSSISKRNFSTNEFRPASVRGNKAILPFKKMAKSHDGSTMKVFRSSNKYCKTCPLRAACIGKSDFKAITESTDKPFYDEMHERLKTRKAKRLKKLRSSTVEPVLGTLINFRGMKRIWTRGIKNANKFMIGAAIAYNLKKWMNYRAKKVKVVVMELRVEQNRTEMNIFLCFFNWRFSK
jgi:Transposase DDE domain